MVLLELRPKGRYLSLFAVVAVAVPRHKLRFEITCVAAAEKDPRVICSLGFRLQWLVAIIGFFVLASGPVVSGRPMVQGFLKFDPAKVRLLESRRFLARVGVCGDPVLHSSPRI